MRTTRILASLGLLLPLAGGCSTEAREASANAAQPPAMPTQEEHDAKAKAAITEQNADEEFDKLQQEIEQDG